MASPNDSFVQNYLAECRENLGAIDSVVIDLKKSPRDHEKLEELLRLLHSVKGSSRMMGFETMETMAHGLEDIFRGVRDQLYPLSPDLIELILKTSDFFDRSMDLIRDTGEDKLTIAPLLVVFEKALTGAGFSVEGLNAYPRDQQREEDVQPASTPGRDYETIRIRLSRIDGLIRNLNSLIIKQFLLKRQRDDLSSLSQDILALRDLVRSDGGSERFSATEMEKSLDLLSKKSRKMSNSFSDDFEQFESASSDVQDQVLSLRMLPLSLVLSPLKKMVEQISISLDKDISFITRGTELMLDKSILEQINDPIIHLVRNAIDHGIESPEQRQKSGKNPGAVVEINCHAESGRIRLDVRDDGGGLDYEAIKARAKRQWPEMEAELDSMDENGLSSLLFKSGFTTCEKVSNLSGRGVGLDIVRSKIDEIKGKISIQSTHGEGTTFSISLPLSLATVDGFFVVVGSKRFLIPSAFVREINTITKNSILSVLNRNVIRVRDELIPVYPLAALVDEEETEETPQFSAIIVESMGETIGILVDEVLNFASMIYKPVPGRLNKLKGIQGVVFDENFSIINILYVPDLINRFKSIRSIAFKKKFSRQGKEYKKILVVDDSLSTREIEKSILETDGYKVEMAQDGIDALEKMKGRYFHLILTDIQMPRMDGKTLIENIRRQEAFATLPIIVVSSETGEEVHRQLEELGANAIFHKREFDRANLLNAVQELIG